MTSQFTHLQIANLTHETIRLARELVVEPFETVELDAQAYRSDPDLAGVVNFLLRGGRISVTPR